MHDSTLLTRIYHLKLIIFGGALVLLGLSLSLFADWLAGMSGTSHLLVAILQALSDVLLVTGAIGIAVDFFTGRDKEAADTQRTRTVLKELTPDFTDAVLEGLAVKPDDLKRVASPELLDDIATNAMGLRLGDDQFARELYADIRDQVINAAERWYDARVKILLGIPRSSTYGATRPTFDVIVRWEYTVTPKHRMRHFTVVSDPQRYEQFAAEAGATSAWFKPPTPGIDVTKTEAFELVQFAVDGHDLTIDRTSDEHSQTYTVDLGETAVMRGEPVVVSFAYCTRLPQSGHLLHFDVDRPTRGLDIELDYADAGIARMKLLDYISSSAKARVSELPESTSAKVITLGYDGWVMPRAGVTFVWTLESEQASTPKHDRAHYTKAA